MPVSVCGLEGIQQTVDAADEVLSLEGQILLALDVRLLLDFPRHQPLRLLAGAAHQLLHLAVQLLHFSDLMTQSEKAPLLHVPIIKNLIFPTHNLQITNLISQVGPLCLEAGLQRADFVGESAVVRLQGLSTAVERPRVAGLLVAVDHLVHVAVQAQTFVDQS